MTTKLVFTFPNNEGWFYSFQSGELQKKQRTDFKIIEDKYILSYSAIVI